MAYWLYVEMKWVQISFMSFSSFETNGRLRG